MIRSEFDDQIKRLRVKFGDKAFDPETVALIATECITLKSEEFAKIASFFLGTRKHINPPMLPDFKEAKLRAEKLAFNREVDSAADTMSSPPWQGGLKAFLAKEYPGCKTLWEAVEVRKLHRAIAVSEGRNPDLEPTGGRK